MNPDDKKFIACIGLFAVIMIGGYASLILYTGFNTPFSVVMSQSMQHDDDQSQIGCIDTGDIVIVREVDKCQIQSFVEGTQSGYSSFGDYGSVIIYNRNQWQNPVIHRAILWLDYDAGTSTWSAPSLEDYEGEWYWEKGGIRHYTNTGMSGTLHLNNITASGKDVKMNLDDPDLKDGGSGYLTMGDNRNNNYLDQHNGAITDTLVGMDEIRSVPVFEIPWVGTVKILLKNDGENLEHVPNSLPSFVMAVVALIAIFIVIDVFYISREYRNNPCTKNDDEYNQSMEEEDEGQI